MTRIASFASAFAYSGFAVGESGAEADLSEGLVTSCAPSDAVVTTCALSDILVTTEGPSDSLATEP